MILGRVLPNRPPRSGRPRCAAIFGQASPWRPQHMIKTEDVCIRDGAEFPRCLHRRYEGISPNRFKRRNSAILGAKIRRAIVK